MTMKPSDSYVTFVFGYANCEKTFWLIHTARERNKDLYREQDWHNKKQWVMVPVPVSYHF